MKTLATAAATLSLLLAPLAEASPKNGRGNGNGNGNGAWASGSHCPPGLAGRSPECVPPGQARRGEVDTAREDGDEREAAGDWAAEIIEVDEDDRDGERALAIVGTLIGLAMIERAQREAEPEAATLAPVAVAPAPPVAIAPATPFFSLSEVPSRPSSIEALATASLVGDAADLGYVADAADPESTIAPAGRLVPLSPLPDPVPTPEEEAQLTDVFRRAADDGATGF